MTMSTEYNNPFESAVSHGSIYRKLCLDFNFSLTFLRCVYHNHHHHHHHHFLLLLLLLLRLFHARFVPSALRVRRSLCLNYRSPCFVFLFWLYGKILFVICLFSIHRTRYFRFMYSVFVNFNSAGIIVLSVL
jgi:hypothetical protein